MTTMPGPAMCAFCADTAEGGPVDHCALIVVARWRGAEPEQREQQFFAHAECLRARLRPDVAPLARVLDVDWDGDELQVATAAGRRGSRCRRVSGCAIGRRDLVRR